MNLKQTAIFIVLGTGALGAMSVEDAYRAIPHNRTVFDPTSAVMNSLTAAYLQKLFYAVDLGIVAKMTVLRRAESSEIAYRPVWDQLDALHPSPELKPVQDLIRDALTKESDYLEEYSAKSAPFNASDPRIQNASNSLHLAYTELMRLYPRENAHNKQAFYDYLCALDFL